MREGQGACGASRKRIVTLAYRAECRAYSLRRRGQSEKTREPGQNGKQKRSPRRPFSISKRRVSLCLVQTFSHTKRLLCEALAACNLSGLKATGADIHLFALSVNNDGNALDIWLKCAGHRAMRVRDRTTSNSVFTAEITNL